MSKPVFLKSLYERGGSLSNAALKAELGWDDEIYEKIKAELCEAGLAIKGHGRGGSVKIAENQGTTFLAALYEMDSSSSNTTLKAKLGWDDETYEKTKAQLCDAGLIRPRKGPGGGVKIVETQSIVSVELEIEEITDIGQNIKCENDLYNPMQTALESGWQKRMSLDQFHIEKTAHQGKKATGGNWTRPDLTVVGLKKSGYFKNISIEVHTFEIKPFSDINIKGVLEALSHREAATRSYVVYHTNGQDFSTFYEHSRIAQLAARHGVGVFAAKNPSELSEWVEIVAAQRAEPDLDLLDKFVEGLSPEAKTKIHKWF